MIIRQIKDYIKLRINEYLDGKVKDFTGQEREIYLRSTEDYDFWIRRVEEAEEKIEPKPPLSYRPRISILVPVYNVEMHLFKDCVDSCLNQTYDNLELVLCDDCSTFANVRPDMEAFAKADPRIKILFAEKNGGISKTTNMALSVATGEFVAFLDCDDVLSLNALYENVKLLNENPSLDVIYSDEDKIDEKGERRMYPYFKPDYSPDTLLSFNYFCHFVVMRRSLVNKVGGLRSEYDGAQDHDLVLRVTEETDKIAHISKILYHWRMREGSTAANPDSKNYAMIAAEKLKMETIERRGFTGRVETVVDVSRVVYDIKGKPKVSVIIPVKDNPDSLRTCIKSFAEHTEYSNCELILADTGSNPENTEKYKKIAEEFGGRLLNGEDVAKEKSFGVCAMCNLGAENAKGEYLLFLREDVEIIDGKWLSVMLGAAGLPHAGAVGAKLLYPGGNQIYEDGIISIAKGPKHILRGCDDNAVYYVHQNKLDLNILAVSAACLLVKKNVFKKVGGFNEDFSEGGFDTEFCIRVYKSGLNNIIRNDAKLICHDKCAPENESSDKLFSLHPEFKGKDPYYNRHFDRFKGDFSLFYDLYEDYSVIEAGPFYNEGIPEDVKICVDYLSLDYTLGVRGWARFKGHHNMEPVSLYIRGKENAYIIKTKKAYRKEAAIRCPWSKDAVFSGFKTEVEKSLLANDDYELFVLKNGKIYDTKVRFTKE